MAHITLTYTIDEILSLTFNAEKNNITKYSKVIPFNYKHEYEHLLFKDFIYKITKIFKQLDKTIFKKELIDKLKTVKELELIISNYNNTLMKTTTAYEDYFLPKQNEFIKTTQEIDILQKQIKELKKSLDLARSKQ